MLTENEKGTCLLLISMFRKLKQKINIRLKFNKNQSQCVHLNHYVWRPKACQGLNIVMTIFQLNLMHCVFFMSYKLLCLSIIITCIM